MKGLTGGRGHIAVMSYREFLNKWSVQFDTAYGGPLAPVLFDPSESWASHPDPSTLESWTLHPDLGIKYYSGTAVYTNTFKWEEDDESTAEIAIDSIYNIATVKVNGIDCGTLWTRPFVVDITQAVKPGQNKIEIIVTNTWTNRLIGDKLLPVEKESAGRMRLSA